MLYAILAYHPAGVVESWTPEQGAALMGELLGVQDKMIKAGKLGPAARLAFTSDAVTVRGDAMVVDGPFAETKEHLLGFYLVNCETRDEAIAIAKDLQRINVTAVYEVRPVPLYVPGAALPAG